MSGTRRVRAVIGRRALLGALLFLLVASVAPVPAASAVDLPANPWYHLDAGRLRIDLWFGWSSTCPHCQKAKPWLEEYASTRDWLTVHSLQVDGADSAASIATLSSLAGVVGETFDAVPAFFYGGRLVTGFVDAATSGPALAGAFEAYRDEVARALGLATPAPTSALPTAAPSPTAVAPITLPFIGPIDATSVSLPILAVVLGGLDAFNPCALSVLLFLMSVLVGARSRARIALVGGTFVAVSGLVYFALMAAWLNLFLAFGAFRLVTVIAGLAAVVAATINLKDYAWYGHGPSLVIPGSARPALFGRILDIGEATRLPALLASTILVAAVANSYEMLCTGGFPVVFTRVLTLEHLPTAAYYGYLALYNVVYVLPLLAIVLVFTWSLGSGRIGEREARRLKLLSGLLMLGFGLLLLLAPDRLTDLVTSVGLFAGAVVMWLAIIGVGRLRQTA